MQVPAPLEYERATSVEHAISLLGRLGSEARLIAGGHSLIPMMKLRLANLEYVIDINDLHDELGYVRVGTDEVRIGAMTRHRELLESPELAALFPIFADAERVIADPIVRNRGTIGGSLCQADPSEDLTAVCTTLDASCVIRNAEGERVVSMEDFHRGPYETAVEQSEMLTEIRIPVRANGSSAYTKVERRAGDWAVTSAGAAVWMDGDLIADARVGLAAVGPNTAGIPAISEAMRGQAPSEELYTRAAEIASESCSPTTDNRGTARVQAPSGRRAHAAFAAARRRTHPGRRRRRPAEEGLTMQVTMSVNGESVTRDIEGRLLLVHFLRDTLGLTGTHWGCDTSNCGTCVAWLDGEPVKTCTVLAAMADGHEVRTVEGLEQDGVLDPVQEGFMRCHGLQCGFCTPGMLMTARALLDRDPDPDEQTIREAISGQICRCTGYTTIVRSVQWAAEHSAETVGSES